EGVGDERAVRDDDEVLTPRGHLTDPLLEPVRIPAGTRLGERVHHLDVPESEVLRRLSRAISRTGQRLPDGDPQCAEGIGQRGHLAHAVRIDLPLELDVRRGRLALGRRRLARRSRVADHDHVLSLLESAYELLPFELLRRSQGRDQPSHNGRREKRTVPPPSHWNRRHLPPSIAHGSRRPRTADRRHSEASIRFVSVPDSSISLSRSKVPKPVRERRNARQRAGRQKGDSGKSAHGHLSSLRAFVAAASHAALHSRGRPSSWSVRAATKALYSSPRSSSGAPTPVEPTKSFEPSGSVTS